MQSDTERTQPASTDQLAQIDQLFKSIGQFYPLDQRKLTSSEADEIIHEATRQLHRSQTNQPSDVSTSPSQRQYNMGLARSIENYLQYAVSIVGIIVGLTAMTLGGLFTVAYFLKWQNNLPDSQPIICSVVFVVGLVIVATSLRKLLKTRRIIRFADVNGDGGDADQLPASPTMISLIDSGFRSLGLSYDFSRSRMTLAEARELLDQIYDISDAIRHRWRPKYHRVSPLDQLRSSLRSILNTILGQSRETKLFTIGTLVAIASGWLISIMFAAQNILMLSVTIILIVVVVVSFLKSDTDYDGYMDDRGLATAEQLALLEFGNRLIGQVYYPKVRPNKREIRRQFAMINQQLNHRPTQI